MKYKRVAMVILAGALVAEGAVADWALLQMLNGFEVEINVDDDVIRAGRAARNEMKAEGEPMLDESVLGEGE